MGKKRRRKMMQKNHKKIACEVCGGLNTFTRGNTTVCFDCDVLNHPVGENPDEWLTFIWEYIMPDDQWNIFLPDE